MTLPEITVTLPVPSSSEIEDNRRVVRAAFQAKRQAKVRLALSVYAPGTEMSPGDRYYSLLGTTPTIICKTPEAVEEFLIRFNQFLNAINGWRPKEVEVVQS